MILNKFNFENCKAYCIVYYIQALFLVKQTDLKQICQSLVYESLCLLDHTPEEFIFLTLVDNYVYYTLLPPSRVSAIRCTVVLRFLHR